MCSFVTVLTGPKPFVLLNSAGETAVTSPKQLSQPIGFIGQGFMLIGGLIEC